MTAELIVFIFLGILLLLFLPAAFARPADEEPRTVLEDHPAYPMYSSNSGPELLTCIFNSADLRYVRGLQNPQLLQLFRRERRRLALLFLSDLRARTHQIKNLHTISARQASNPNPSTELLIAFDYFSILALSWLLSLLVRLLGISAVRLLAAPASALSGRLSHLAMVSESAAQPSRDASST